MVPRNSTSLPTSTTTTMRLNPLKTAVHLGDKLLILRLVSPQNETAVLKDIPGTYIIPGMNKDELDENISPHFLGGAKKVWEGGGGGGDLAQL